MPVPNDKMEAKHNYDKHNSANRKSMIGENLGISGTKIILNKETSIVRRSLWLLLILSMTGVMIWQFIKRLETFFSHPIAVNVEIQYEKYVRFPVIVICNDNFITLSGAYALNFVANESNGKIGNQLNMQKDYLRAVTEVSQNESMVNETLKWFENIYGPTRELNFDKQDAEGYISTGSHNKSNMLKDCIWQNMPCTENDFTAVDLMEALAINKCYLFNANDQDPMYTKVPGIYGALKLRLDVQQYQYTNSTTLAAGITVAVLDEMVNIYTSSELAHHISAGRSDFYTFILLLSCNNALFWFTAIGSDTTFYIATLIAPTLTQ